MPGNWQCMPPCTASFETHRALGIHRAKKPRCQKLYNDWLQSIVTEPGILRSMLGTIDEAIPEDMEIDPQPLGMANISSDAIQGGIQPSIREPTQAGCVTLHLTAGRVVDVVKAPFEQWREKMDSQGYRPYHPFESEIEFGLGAWLHESGISRDSINSFLKLPYTQRMLPSFGSAGTLVNRLSDIPYPGPNWVQKRITPTSGTISGDIFLIYRDPLLVIEYLMSRPSLASSMQFAPQRTYSDADKVTRLYSEMYTGDWWWTVQDSLPVGSTVIPVILGSDSTHLTNFAGGKKAWPLYLTIGNIMTKVRNRPSNNAWMLIAYLPIVEFLDNKKIWTTLANRLWHQCIRVVVSTLIDPGLNGQDICDSVGRVRHCYPLVAGHLGDLPEQCLVAVASRATSPVAIVSSSQFGNPVPRPSRTREWILHQIDTCRALVDASNVKAYQKVAKEKGLNGVDLPYWIDLPKYQPELVVCPDILHGVVRFWRDHPLAWSRKLVNAEEYDKRLTSLQYIPGYRHFKSGISHLSQWTGREDRELQRVHIAIIADCPKINATVLRNQRAFHDFLYLVQYNFHSDATLGYMHRALETFHATKNEYIKNRARSLAHFKIPKMFELQRYEEFIRLKGSVPQYSTEITESLHRPLVKDLYHLTNHKEFIVQMCWRLSRSERLGFHKEFSAWCQEQDRQSQLQKLYQAYTPGYRRRAMGLHQQATEDTQENEQRIPVRMRFEASRLWLALKPHHSKQSVLAIAAQYGLPDLPAKLHHFLRTNLQGDPYGQEEALDVQCIDVWRKVRIHIPDVQDEDAHSQDHSVEAIPPSESLPYGRCHCVLVHDTNEAEATGIEGYRIVQVRLIFRIHLRDTRSLWHKGHLVYAQYFSRPKPANKKDLGMFMVSRQDQNGIRGGEVIPMESISRFVQLIPRFGPAVDGALTSENSMDICRDYYVNAFADKEIYQSVW